MLTYDLTQQPGIPLYEALYRCIRQDILTGTLPPQTRLPSKRALAEHLHLSVITVESAYRQLEAEGYLITRPRRGFFVCPVERIPPAVPQTAPALSPPPEPVWQLDLTANRVDGSRFPAGTWARLTRQVLSEGDAFFSPTPNQGLPALRQAIAQDLRDFRGMSVSPEQIVVGAGAEYLYLLLAQLLGSSAPFAVEDPGYPKIRKVYTRCGVDCRPVPLDPQGVDPAALAASGAGVVHLSPSHHYPTGIITPIARRQALLRWAEAAPDRYILEDDYDSEFRFSGRPIPALQSLDGGERVVYLNTFAKSLAPSLRISYMVLPPHLLERWRREFWFYSSTVPSFEQYALARFMERGHFERHLNRTRTRYKARREALLAAARDTGLTRVGSFAGGDAGLHLLLWMDGRWSEAELVARAVDAGVGVAPLSACDLTPPPPGRPPALILGYTRIAAVDMAPALRRLKAAWAF